MDPLPPTMKIRPTRGLTRAVLSLLLAAAACRGLAAGEFAVAPPADVRTEAALARTVSVAEFGAKGDGRADDTAALQRALDGGRRTVLIPAGTYEISAALRLDSETIIRADARAVIRLAAGAGNSVEVFLVRNRDEAAGNHDIVIEGGIWDGNNEHNPRGAKEHMPCYTGVAFNFINVQRLTLRNLVIRNPETYSIRAARLSDFRIEDIGFDATSVRENQDGVHLNGFCERGVIRNLQALSPFATNDDMVALNADDGSGDAFVSQQGMVSGPIRDITVEHLRAPSVFSFVRLLSSQQPLENVRISDIAGGARFYAINMDRWRFPVGGGRIRNVVLSRIAVHKAFDSFSRQSRAARRPLIHIQSAVENFRIEDFRRADVEQPPAFTLVLDNGQRNRLRLEGLTFEQQQAVLAASPGLLPESFAPVTATIPRALAVEFPGALTLPSGGFSLLELNPAASPDQP